MNSRAILCFWALGTLLAGLAHAATPVPAPAAAEVKILDELSSWRMFHVLKPPVTDNDGALVKREMKVAWIDADTPEPPAGWQKPEFDDSAWLRTTVNGGVQTSFLARQCLRGKFQVANPAAVKDLSLVVKYHGGAIVSVNGKEIARQNLPSGTLKPDALAEAYPLEVFVTPNGDLLAMAGTYTAQGRKAGPPDEESKRRMAQRVRTLTATIPAAALRQGVNVIAIELIRAPYHKILLETDEQAAGKLRRNRYDWYTCEFKGVKLAAGAADGLGPVGRRPDGFQVWNATPLEPVTTFDAGDPCEPLRPLRLVSARNGIVSNKVVVGATTPIAGLKATAGELRGPGGAIPAANLAVRYGLLWGVETGVQGSDGTMLQAYPRWPGFFGAVADQPPAEVPVSKDSLPIKHGAVMPVWLTARVPGDAAAGKYAGKLTLQANGWGPTEVPVELTVADCTLPEPQGYTTWFELIQVPDTTSVEYSAPLWSDQHWELIAKSLRLLRDSGSRILYLPAIAHTNLGNAESMIRWVKKDDAYEWDFSIMDRYLDLALKEMGQPKVVTLQVWDIYMCTKESVGKRFSGELDQRQATGGGNNPLVTVLDPATKATSNQPAPKLEDARSKAIWTELVKQVKARLQARGLADRLMFGMFTDAMPPKVHFEFFHGVDATIPWVHQGHGLWTDKIHKIAEVGYQASVWGGFRFGDGLKQTNQTAPPIVASLHGWKRPRLDAVYERNNGLDGYPSSRWYFYPETGITGELRGVGRTGADYWKVVKDNKGRRVSWCHDRFAEGVWGGGAINLILCSSAIAPGPDGPVATTRLLNLGAGMQAAEARIIIERALTEPALKGRLGADLAGRCQAALDRRLFNMWRSLSNFQLGGPYFFGIGAWRWTPAISGNRWFLGSGYEAAEAELFALAGEVQRKAGGK